MSAKAKSAETQKMEIVEETESNTPENEVKKEKVAEVVDNIANKNAEPLPIKEVEIDKEENEDELKTKKGNVTNAAETEIEPEVKGKRLRKSVRTTRFKSKATTNRNAAAAASNAAGNANGSGGGGNTASTTKTQPKGRSRRSIFKKQPHKMPVVQVSTRFVDSVFYKGSYIQTGDIVSLMDAEDNVFYAQIRGLLVDSYCEKSAFLTWLLPTQASPDPKVCFDPATYLIGSDEELSRKLSYMEFVMHAPSNYYLDRTKPFPVPDYLEQDSRTGGYIWTCLPKYKRAT